MCGFRDFATQRNGGGHEKDQYHNPKQKKNQYGISERGNNTANSETLCSSAINRRNH
jgi:hypothetical protein